MSIAKLVSKDKAVTKTVTELVQVPLRVTLELSLEEAFAVMTLFGNTVGSKYNDIYYNLDEIFRGADSVVIEPVITLPHEKMGKSFKKWASANHVEVDEKT